DASSSRKQMQQKIAAQAYVLSKSLTKCGIPVQIYSYCSIRGYTVMHIFKEYDDYGVEALKRFSIPLAVFRQLIHGSVKHRRVSFFIYFLQKCLSYF
ncbi:hypothetical protein NE450_15500, partial [[Eubacterium] rectale]|nr:hypothetical protein [Agathobacter rectalis]